MKVDDRLICKVFARFTPVCIVFALASYYLANNPLNIYVSIAICLACGVVALIFHLLAKKIPAFYMISNLCNTVGAAFAVSIYYGKVSNDPSLRDIPILTLMQLTVFFAVDLLIGASKKRKTAIKIASVLLYAAVIAFFTVKWITDGSAFYSLGFFMTLLAFVYVLARVFISDENSSKTPKYLSLVSFGGYILIASIVTFIILVIISEGEILEGIGEGLFEGVGELFCDILENNSTKRTKL